ncbi:HAD family phosphatase [Paracoccus versutus]|uniref:HAD family hydrolase n=1 Tax=Paracoccus versutus TaxID=34007 RepID=UPI001FB6ACC9|nr:HAD family phosphatase [Paracoccus versutus]MCJ1901384.1 HAD family phosphatase [Paracoccus versutus]
MTAIIFDCDGVLVNTEILSARAYRNVYARHGLTVEPEAFQKVLGLKQGDILKTLRGSEGGLLPVEAEFELTAEILDLIRAHVEATSGIADVLRGLQLPFCVASSSDVARIRLSLETAGLLTRFEGRIFSSSMVRNGKPAPDLFLFAAESLGVPATECIVFEDSVAGIVAAQAAGMYPVGYLGGGHLPPSQAELLRAAGARALIEHWDEALPLISTLA